VKMWWVIFLKEFFEVLRDKRALFQVFVSPLLVTPLILGLTGSLARRQAMDSLKEPARIGVVGWAAVPTLHPWFAGTEQSEKLVLVPLAKSEADAAVRARRVDAVVVLGDDAAVRWQTDQTVPVRVVFDPGNDKSRGAGDRAGDLFRKRAERIVASRLAEAGMSQQITRPFDVGDSPLPGAGGAGVRLISSFLPYLLALSSLMGGVFVANDTVAGEKERGTLETLLSAPVPRRALAIGKFAVTASMALLSGVLSVVGTLWPFVVPLPMFRWMTEGGLSLAPVSVAAMFLVLVPLSVFGAGVLLAISTIARNQKEAQASLTPVLLVGSVLGILSLVMPPDSSLATAAAPVLGPALVLKQALQGATRLPFALLAGLASAAYAAVALVLATRLFEKESVLMKS
jgi:sodium transport system permease protein